MQNIYWRNPRYISIFAVADSALFYGVVLVIYHYLGSKKDHNIYYLLTLFPPLVGILIAIYVLAKTDKYWKILPILGIAANAVVFFITFMVYSFSYWQF